MDPLRPNVHAFLDGEIPRGALTPEEEMALREMEEAIRLGTDRARLASAPDLRGRVMAAVTAPEPASAAPVAAPWERLAAWLWAPWQLTVRPAYLVAGAMVALLLVLPFRGAGGPGAEIPVAQAPGAGASERLFVQFRLEAAGANTVAVAGSFTGWEPSYELREVAPGTWTALIALEPGVHDYLFVVDGREWIPDPVARPVEDGFGGTNSRLFLVSPSSST